MKKNHVYGHYASNVWRKTFKVMKLTFLLVLLGVFSVSAEGYGQGGNISLKMEHVSLEDILQELKAHSEYIFVYSDQQIENIEVDLFEVKDANLEVVMNECLQGTDLEFYVENNVVVIRKKTPVIIEEVKQEKKEVKGTVTDDEGNTLPGVSVVVKGTTTGVATDIDGNYTITFENENAVLLFSFVGMIPQEVTYTGQKKMNISLNPDAKQMDEVIVTGYQTLAKERSAGSFAKVDVSIVQNRPSSGNILKSLEGLVPGLVVNNSPSADKNPFLIRGLTTIGTFDAQGRSTGGGTNRNPLYVVDGIAVDDIDNIESQDIESMNVLKDATASSIWGARAANGVIVITTKKGKLNQKIKVEYDGYVKFEGKPDFDYVPMLNSKQFIEAARLSFNPIGKPYGTISTFINRGSVGLRPHEYLFYDQYNGVITDAQAQTSLDSLASIDNRKHVRDLLYRNASRTNHTVSLSGGGDAYSFYGSLGYSNVTSNRPGEKNNTYRINLRQDLKFNKNLSAYLLVNLSDNFRENKRNQKLDYILPYQMLRDEQGNNISVPEYGYNDLSREQLKEFEDRSRVSLDYVPLDEFNNGYTKSEVLNSRVTAGIKLNLFKGLRYEATFGYNNSFNKSREFDNEDSYRVRRELLQFTVADTPEDTPKYYLPSSGGRYELSDGKSRNWTIRNQLIWDRNWNDEHQLTVLAGHESSEKKYVSTGSVVRGYDDHMMTHGSVDMLSLTKGVNGVIMPNYYSRGKLLSDDSFRSSDVVTRFESHYTNAAYTYMEKYSFNASWRIDSSNLFGKDKSAQNKPVWSVGANWVMGKEDFMADIDWLDRLMVRATYGITGNAPVQGLAASEDIVAATNSSWYPGENGGMYVKTPANRKLTWERTTNINLGFDFSVLNRLRGSIDIYSKKTDDLLGNLESNNFNGYPTVLGNLGDMTNKGIEFSLTAAIIQNDSFKWTSSINGSYNENMITDINFFTPVTTGYGKVKQEYVNDYPAFAVFAYDFAGLDNMGDPQVKLADGTITKEKNAALPDDIRYMGSQQPKWSLGFSNNFTYKDFSLSVNMVSNLGHVMRKPIRTIFTSPFNQRIIENVSTQFLDRWQNPGDENITNIPSFVPLDGESLARRDVFYYTKGDINVVSASYIKLTDLTLAYRLPKNIINLNNLTFRATLSNVMLWTANKDDINPEFQGNMPTGQNSITVGIHMSL